MEHNCNIALHASECQNKRPPLPTNVLYVSSVLPQNSPPLAWPSWTLSLQAKFLHLGLSAHWLHPCCAPPHLHHGPSALGLLRAPLSLQISLSQSSLCLHHGLLGPPLQLHMVSSSLQIPHCPRSLCHCPGLPQYHGFISSVPLLIFQLHHGVCLYRLLRFTAHHQLHAHLQSPLPPQVYSLWCEDTPS